VRVGAICGHEAFSVRQTLVSRRKCDEININEIAFRSNPTGKRSSVLLVFAFAVSIGSSEAAVLHPWCASGTGEESGALSCSYDSYEQCVANVGICQANPAVQPLPGLNVRSASPHENLQHNLPAPTRRGRLRRG
jgi:hypothetical protein